MDEILKYFPELTEKQQKQFVALFGLYSDWNAKINVISRKDIDNLYLHHVLHSLAIAKIITFKPQTSIMDVGTGGGFPGIPLAILFPNVHFTLIDSIGKKIRVATEVGNAIGLENVRFKQIRVQEEKDKYDFVLSRAVMNFEELVNLVRKNIKSTAINALPNGLICLKGGDVQQEIKLYKKTVEIHNLSDYFTEEFFETKKVVYMPLN